MRNPDDARLLFQNRWLREQLMEGRADSDGGSGGFSPEVERKMLINDRRAAVEGDFCLQEQLPGWTGDLVYCNSQRFLIPRDQGSPPTGAVIGGITARVMVERHLGANAWRLQMLLHTIPARVWLKDRQGVYLLCNPPVEAVFGIAKSEITGKREHDLIDAEQAHLFRAMDRAAIAAGGLSTDEYGITFASDGHRELLETIKTPMYGADGRLMGVLGIARNITERKQMEQRLRQQLDELSRWQAGILNREDRIQELETEINTRLAEKDRPMHYPNQAERP